MSAPRWTVVVVIDNDPKVFGTFTTRGRAEAVRGYVLDQIERDAPNEPDLNVTVKVCAIGYADDARRDWNRA